MEIGVITLKEFIEEIGESEIPNNMKMRYYAGITNTEEFQTKFKEIVKEKFNEDHFRFRINYNLEQFEIYK